MNKQPFWNIKVFIIYSRWIPLSWKIRQIGLFSSIHLKNIDSNLIFVRLSSWELSRIIWEFSNLVSLLWINWHLWTNPYFFESIFIETYFQYPHIPHDVFWILSFPYSFDKSKWKLSISNSVNKNLTLKSSVV